MADTVTTTLGLTKPEVGASEDSWGEKINTNFDLVDDALDGTTAVSLDINGGTIDGAVIGGATPAAGTFTTLTANTSLGGTLSTAAQPNVTSVGTLTGLTVSGSTSLAGASTSADITFGDNDKAIFGAGSDLQIYHSGSNSVITDVGQGSLYVGGDNNVIIASGDLGTTKARFTATDVELYYAGSEKLATTSTGIDVTGTVTADGLTVGSTSGAAGLFTGYSSITGVNSVNNGEIRLGSNAAFQGRVSYEGATSGVLYIENSYNNNAADIVFRSKSAGTAQNKLKLDGNGDISFYEDTGTTPKFFWDASAESLGIGTSSPQDTGVGYSNLTVNGTTGGVIDLTDDDVRVGSFFNTANDVSLGNFTATGFLGFRTNSTERMRIDSSGNVGIGTSSPDGTLHVKDAVAQVYIQSNDGQPAQIVFGDVSDASRGRINYDASDNIIFENNNLNERMRIDSSGNLLVGTTNVNAAASNVLGHSIKAGGLAEHSNDNVVVRMNRKDSDGDILEFRKDGTTVGSIGVEGGDLVLGTGTNCGIQFNDGNAAIRPFNMASNSPVDNAVDLGISGTRFKDLYLSGGVYLGGTGSANKLDDYETGTWTPVLVGNTAAGSYTVASTTATYVKVGKIVHVAASMTITVNSAGSGLAKFGGLPFTSIGSTRGLGPCRTSGVALPASTLFALSSLWTSNTTDFSLSCTRDNNSLITLDVSGLSTGDVVDFRMTYEVA